MITSDWKLDPRGERLAIRIDAFETASPPQGVKFAMARGVRSAFVRSRGCMLRLAAGEITGAWCFRPQNAKITFSDSKTRYDDGFYVDASVSKANVFRQPNNKTAICAFVMLLEEMERRIDLLWSVRDAPTREANEVSVEAASDLQLAKHRNGTLL